MPSILSRSRITLLAAVACGFATSATPVEAQQPPTNPSPSATPLAPKRVLATLYCNPDFGEVDPARPLGVAAESMWCLFGRFEPLTVALI